MKTNKMQSETNVAPWCCKWMDWVGWYGTEISDVGDERMEIGTNGGLFEKL